MYLVEEPVFIQYIFRTFTNIHIVCKIFNRIDMGKINN